MFDFWPLPKEDIASNSQPLTTYQLSSILDQAIKSSHLPETLDLMQFLLNALPSRSTYNCPELLEFLDLLANKSTDRATRNICRDQLQQMLRPWVRPLANFAPVQLPAIGNANVSTDSQQQSPTSVSICQSQTASAMKPAPTKRSSHCSNKWYALFCISAIQVLQEVNLTCQ